MCADPQNSQYTLNTTHDSVETRCRHKIASKRKAVEQNNTVHVENVKLSIVVRNPSANCMRIFDTERKYCNLGKAKFHTFCCKVFFFFYNLNVIFSGSRHTGCQSVRYSTAYFPVSLVEICNKILSLKAK